MKGIIASAGWGIISPIIASHFGLGFGETLALTLGGVFVITGLTMSVA